MIANTDLGSIDSFAEVVADLSTEVEARIADVNAEEQRAQEAENNISNTLTSEVQRAQSTEANLFNTYYQKLILNGEVNGTNVQFDFDVMIMPNSESIYLNGLLMTIGDDYNYNGNGIEFINAPQVGDKVKCYAVQGPAIPVPA